MRRLLGVEVPDDAAGRAPGHPLGRRRLRLLPELRARLPDRRQLWEALERDLGPQDDALARADVTAIRGWLADRVHAHGRRLDTEPLVERATGRGMEAAPFLRHARGSVGALSVGEGA